MYLIQDFGSDLTTLALPRCARRTLLCCAAHRSHYGTWVPCVTFCRESRHSPNAIRRCHTIGRSRETPSGVIALRGGERDWK
ncbi:hypothetical protein ACFPRL_02730 [Pseudoclavibacter helvolus]